MVSVLTGWNRAGVAEPGYTYPSAYPGGPPEADDAEFDATPPGWLRAISIILALILVAGLVYLFQRDSPALDARVGDCVAQSDGQYRLVECSSPSAEYRVLSVHDDLNIRCSDPDVDVTVREEAGGGHTWCMQLAVSVGTCVTERSTPVDCVSAVGSSYRITAIVLGTQDPAVCPEGSAARIYVAANKVRCFEANG
jgi:hypothetical protein